MHADYIIIGQGLCGSFLSYYLLKAGKKVIVIDDDRPFTASKVASGVINPVTGRRIVTTWRIDELLPFCRQAYAEMGTITGHPLIQNCPVVEFNTTLQMQEAFEKRIAAHSSYLQWEERNWAPYFNYFFKMANISPCLLVNTNLLLAGWRRYLATNNLLVNETFQWDRCAVEEHRVTYKSYTAQKIICCEGASGTDNPYFSNLPYALNKGEALILKIPGLAAANIYKQGISLVPLNDDLFWAGSSYEWNFINTLPSESFRQKTINNLGQWLKLPFEVVDHVASVRPANLERRPFVGLHPQQRSVAILNGMGTKGCSLAPFFAQQLADHLTRQSPIYPEADVRRFEKTLARKMN